MVAKVYVPFSPSQELEIVFHFSSYVMRLSELSIRSIWSIGATQGVSEERDGRDRAMKVFNGSRYARP
jgi:hypothetical protein